MKKLLEKEIEEIKLREKFMNEQKELFNSWLALIMKKANIDILIIEECDIKNIENYSCSCVYDTFTKAWIFKR